MFVALKKAMLDAGGKTQNDLASDLKISKNTLSRKMKRKSNFTRDQMLAIQDFLGAKIPLDQLFEYRDSPGKTKEDSPDVQSAPTQADQ